MNKKLNKVVIKTATKWKERAKQDRNNRRNITRAQAFALELLDYMDLNNIKQNELAEKMGVSAQQVSKILRAKSNLTFDTIDKIGDALEVTITSPKIEKINTKKQVLLPSSMMQVVHRRTSKIINEVTVVKNMEKATPILDTRMENMEKYRFTANQI
jgi:transcriptional regulator with XRE-family HTH domain